MTSFARYLVAALARDTPAYSAGITAKSGMPMALIRAVARTNEPRILQDVSSVKSRARVRRGMRVNRDPLMTTIFVLTALMVGAALATLTSILPSSSRVLVVSTGVLALAGLGLAVRAHALQLPQSARPTVERQRDQEAAGTPPEGEHLRESRHPLLFNDDPERDPGPEGADVGTPESTKHGRPSPDDVEVLAERLVLALVRGLTAEEKRALAVFREAGFTVEIEGDPDPIVLTGEYKDALTMIVGGNAAEGIRILERLNEVAAARGVTPPLRVVRDGSKRWAS